MVSLRACLSATVACGVLVGCTPQSGGNAGLAQKPSFIVGTLGQSGRVELHQSEIWNGGADEDTVLVAIDSAASAPDSVQLLVRSGPVVMNGDLPNVTHADSMGTWSAAPRALLLRYRASGVSGKTVLAAFVPDAVFDWVKAMRTERPYATRAAVLLWTGGRVMRSEIELAHGS